MSPIFHDRSGLSLTDGDVVVAIAPLCPLCGHRYHYQDRCESLISDIIKPLGCECPGDPQEPDYDAMADDLAAEQAFGGWWE